MKKIDVTEEYAEAYSEVLEVLNYVTEEEYNKIPKDMIELFEANKNINSTFKFDTSQIMKEQQLTLEAKDVLAVLFMDYWANDDQKGKIKVLQNEFEKRHNEKAQEIYNPDNIFKNDNQINQKNIDNKPDLSKLQVKELQVTIYRENKIRKLFQKILSMLHIR